MANVVERGAQLRAGLHNIATQYPQYINEVRGWGLISGMELHPEISLVAGDIVKAAMNEGLLLVPAGPKVVRFVPPLIVTEQEIRIALQKLDKAIATVTK